MNLFNLVNLWTYKDSLSLSAAWIFGIFVRSNFFEQPVSQVYQELTDKREGL